MAESESSRRALSEISHLFLSSLRQKQMRGTCPPQRTPPPKKPVDELTPQEFHQIFAEPAEADGALPPVRALLACHLGPRQMECARRYARHLAASGQQVGLLAVDSGELHLIRFDPQSSGLAESPQSTCTCLDTRLITESLNELSCDLDCWILLTLNPRLSEARTLLKQVRRWVALGTCDHDGVVACYRTLKGLVDIHSPDIEISLAVIDARNELEANLVYRKLSSVCAEFLNRHVSNEGLIADVSQVQEIQVIRCEISHDKAQLAAGSHWPVLAQFFARTRNEPAAHGDSDAQASCKQANPSQAHMPPGPAPQAADAGPIAENPEPGPPAPPPATSCQHTDGELEIIELPAGGTSQDDLVAAFLQQQAGDLVECPLRPPMCLNARLAVSRDRRLILLAATEHNLGGLKEISQAYRWVIENRALLCMAMPQFALDSHQLPHLRLLVDQSDRAQEALRAILVSDTVTMHAYRRVRWGQKHGLLVEAA